MQLELVAMGSFHLWVCINNATSVDILFLTVSKIFNVGFYPGVAMRQTFILSR